MRLAMKIPDAPASEPRVQRPRRAAPADIVRPTRAEIDLAALRTNLRVVERAANGAQVWGVVKADAYGHGAPAVARTLERAGIDGFCVALVEEAIELRSAGVGAPILVMGGRYGGAHREMVENGITPVVFDLGQVESFARLVRARDLQGPIAVHVKIDTGMSRLGLMPRDVRAFLDALADVPEIRVTGVMTHLACADAPDEDSMREQERVFDEQCSMMQAAGLGSFVRHAANSAALLRGALRYDVVRPGIALFGTAPYDDAPHAAELVPAFRVRSEVVDLRTIGPGTTVGYGGLFRATRDTRIATVPMGYADGLPRVLSNVGQMLVRGKRAKIVGAVSMDMCMLDVTDPLGRDRLLAQEVATWANTIPWEVLTQISRRVPRFYREP
jgi:alanine racemase